MPSSPSLATFLAETDASKEDASHTKTVSAEIEVSMEVSISTGKINEVSSPKADTVTGSAPSVVNTDSVCGFALEEVQVEEVQVEGVQVEEVQVEGVGVEKVGVEKTEEQMQRPFLSSLHNMPTEEEARSSVAPVIHNTLPDETLNVSLAVQHMPTEEAQKNDDSMQATKMNEPGDTTKLDMVGALESFENAEVGEEKELKNGTLEVDKGLQVSGKPEAEIEEKENEEKNLVSEGVEGSQTFENPESEQKNGTSENFATVSDVTVASSTVTTLEVVDDGGKPSRSVADRSSEDIKGEGDSQEESNQELEAMEIPPHWHPKPCVHISCIGGSMTEEELLPIFSQYGPISSVSFENERHDSALVRYELHRENADDFLGEVRQATNSTKLGDKTIIVEPFRPDSLLFIGNLTSSIDDSSLQSMFDAHGKIERGFVLRNAEGKSKCYGFVEYSLKSQATAAKVAMGNINMDGRVLRVEWSDCKKVSDMFSTVLFVDRLPREGFNLDTSLQELFGKFGKLRDSHLAIGIGNQYRGFAFVDFYHSICADKAHLALDGYTFQGSNIRVSFANPSKSTQSYKFRYGTQAAQSYSGKGGVSGSGMIISPSLRGSPSMPLMQSRFMNPTRPGMMGYGIGMQFGRGPYERVQVPMHGRGIGMLGPGGRAPLLYGSVASRSGMPRGESNMQRMQAVSITPSAIVQVATAQAKAREEEARARAEAAKQGLARSGVPGDFSSADRYQRPQHNAHQHFKLSDPSHAYQAQRQQSIHQQASLHQQRPSWNQQPVGQIPQTQGMQYHQRPIQNFPQQQQPTAPQMQQSQQQYIQQQHGYSQYGQQAYQSGQQGNTPYNTQMPQYAGQQYQQQQTVYSQQNYGEQYAQVQGQTQPQTQAQSQAQSLQPMYAGAPVSVVSSGTASSGQDAAQQQAYAAYYQQQAQATQQASGSATVTPATTTQQSYEAQWAAYYASQAAYQQQTPSADVGQKRAADQMESYQQNQAAYNYAAYSQDAATYQQQQQTPSVPTVYQQPTDNVASAYQQQASVASNSTQYQQQQVYQQANSYAPQASSIQPGYEQQPIALTTDTYQQQATEATQQVGPTGIYDYNKRPRY